MKKILALVLIVLLSLSLLAACGGGSSEGDAPAVSAGGGSTGNGSSGGDKKLVIGGAWPTIDVGFWGTNWDGFEDKVNELGCDFVQVVAERDANKQNDQIRNLIAQKVDAIVLGCVDGSAVVSAVKEAQAAGIPVVMNNRPLQSDSVVADMSILSDNTLMSYNELVWLAEDARETGQKHNILMLVGALSDENMIQRRDGYRKAIEENSDVLSLVVEVPTDGKQELALTGVQNAMQAYNNINCIVTPADGYVPTMQSALEQINRWKKPGEPGYVAICSFDGAADAIRGYVSGNVYCTAVQDAYGAGAKSAEWAVKLVKGEKPANNVDLDPGMLLTYKNFESIKETIWGWAVYLDQEAAKAKK